MAEKNRGPVAANERLQRYLSRCRVCSRRAAEQLIEAGLVIVNGEKAVTGQKISPGKDVIEYLGKRILPWEATSDYVVLNKPRGVLSSRSDDRGRPTVVQFVEVADTYVYPVGRLDFDSSGLILLTNDGDLAQRLIHPSHKVEKIYRVQVSRKLTIKEMTRFENGVVIDGRKTARATIAPAEPWVDCIEPSNPSVCFKKGSFKIGINKSKSDTGFWYEIVLKEGRKRQIRLMMATFAVNVIQLIRIGIGPVTLHGLPRGWHRRLTGDEINALRGLKISERGITASPRESGSNEKGGKEQGFSKGKGPNKGKGSKSKIGSKGKTPRRIQKEKFKRLTKKR